VPTAVNVETSEVRAHPGDDAPQLKRLLAAARAKLHQDSSATNNAQSKRLAAAEAVARLRKAVEAAGLNWWKYHEENLLRWRSRRDTEKLLALVNADDPDEALKQYQKKDRAQKTKKSKSATAEKANSAVADLADNNQNGNDVDPAASAQVRKAMANGIDALVAKALALIESMTNPQRQQFDAIYRRDYQ